MIIAIILNLGLVLIPMLVWQGYDSRTPKETLAICVALTLSLFASWCINTRNKYLVMFMGFSVLSAYLAPKFTLFLGPMDMTNLWIYKALLYLFVYYALFMAISNWNLKDRETFVEIILKVMMYVGLAMSLYLFIQKIGMDQFFKPASEQINPDVKSLNNASIVGTMGNATLVSPFIAMLIPISFYFRKYLISAIMIVGVILAESRLGIIAMCFTMTFYWFFYRRNAAIAFIIITILSVSGFLYHVHKHHPKERFDAWTHSSGRFDHWKDVLKDFNTPPFLGNMEKPDRERKYCMTGFGPGSYGYEYIARHPGVRFGQVHNEYLEILYNFGIIGLGLFLFALGQVFVNAFKASPYMMPSRFRLMISLLASFVCVCICACGTFVWQVAPIMFYTVVILGFLHNNFILGEDHD